MTFAAIFYIPLFVVASIGSVRFSIESGNPVWEVIIEALTDIFLLTGLIIFIAGFKADSLALVWSMAPA